MLHGSSPPSTERINGAFGRLALGRLDADVWPELSQKALSAVTVAKRKIVIAALQQDSTAVDAALGTEETLGSLSSEAIRRSAAI